MQELTLGFSPCPNDTFMFDAMIHQKIDTEGLAFKVRLADVEQLNAQAFEQELDITKLSYHAMAFLLKDYQLLNSGSALGSGVGPLLIAKQPMSESEINAARIAIPGKFTTANFLLSLAYPLATNKEEMIFSAVENAVLSGAVDAGLIIHENRFTYAEKGLVKLIDLGEFWEKQSGNLIPLGGIVTRRKFPQDLKEKIDQVLKRSIEFAFANRTSSADYVKAHAQEMDEKVMQQHIDLYVNNYSIDLGAQGRNAVEHLFKMAEEKGLVKKIVDEVFV
mgnify:CR=1 FL=1|tara:strand:+ start:10866 stop:11696 length:831 start_codon:yes stop_codon:yes gene_type:complete